MSKFRELEKMFDKLFIRVSALIRRVDQVERELRFSYAHRGDSVATERRLRTLEAVLNPPKGIETDQMFITNTDTEKGEREITVPPHHLHPYIMEDTSSWEDDVTSFTLNTVKYKLVVNTYYREDVLPQEGCDGVN